MDELPTQAFSKKMACQGVDDQNRPAQIFAVPLPRTGGDAVEIHSAREHGLQDEPERDIERGFLRQEAAIADTYVQQRGGNTITRRRGIWTNVNASAGLSGRARTDESGILGSAINKCLSSNDGRVVRMNQLADITPVIAHASRAYPSGNTAVPALPLAPGTPVTVAFANASASLSMLA